MKYNDYLDFARKMLDGNRQIQYISKTKDNDYVPGNKYLEGLLCKRNLSFTPYIYNECSAACRFCSEHLIRNKKAMVCREVNEEYSKKLRGILNDLKELEIFLSLSGKEPTESLDFVEGILKCVKDFELFGGRITEKVMYSNLSGLVENMEQMQRLIEIYHIDRIECSRHHYDEDKNQSIVRFKNSPIKKNEVYEDVVRSLLQLIDVKMVCVVQKGGIEEAGQLKNYLNWAKSMGISQVVFRELALFDDTVERNVTADYIVDHRVELKYFLDNLEEDFEIRAITEGYYYMSFEYEYKGMKVWFEMSDYEEMQKKHESDKVYKLIYYPNGKLCLDWNMNGEIF